MLVKEEEKEVGVVSLSVYHTYWSAVGHVLAPLVLLALFLMQGGYYVVQIEKSETSVGARRQFIVH